MNYYKMPIAYHISRVMSNVETDQMSLVLVLVLSLSLSLTTFLHIFLMFNTPYQQRRTVKTRTHHLIRKENRTVQ